MAKCLMPGCGAVADEAVGVCVNHLAMYRRGDAKVKAALDAEKRRLAERGTPNVSGTSAEEGPSSGRCLVPRCRRPSLVRGVCGACYTYYREKGTGTERGRLIDSVIQPPKTRGGKRPAAKLSRDQVLLGRGDQLDRKVAKFLKSVGLEVIDLKGPGRVVINYDARRCVFLEADR